MVLRSHYTPSLDILNSGFKLALNENSVFYFPWTWVIQQQHISYTRSLPLIFFIISQNVAICPKTFSIRVDGHY